MSMFLPGGATAQLTLLDSFAGRPGMVSLGYSAETELIWDYQAFGATFSSFTRSGAAVGTLPRAGNSANDVDLEVLTHPLTIGTTQLPPGTLLYIDGESGFAEVYAVDPVTGAVLATLQTQFGMSHVVGGAVHAGRSSIFLVQDRVPSGTVNDSVVAEVYSLTGTVLQTFQLAAPFTVNYGDIEVDEATGNLLVVSSDMGVMREVTVNGALVADHALPPGVGGLRGIAIDDARGEAWVCDSSTIFRLGGVAHVPVSSFGCATGTGSGAVPTLAVTTGVPQLGTSILLTLQNPSPTPLSASLGFQIFVPPAVSPQATVDVFGVCWNLPLPFAGTMLPVSPNATILIPLPSDPVFDGASIDWQVLAVDPSSVAGLAVTASRGLTMRLYQ